MFIFNLEEVMAISQASSGSFCYLPPVQLDYGGTAVVARFGG